MFENERKNKLYLLILSFLSFFGNLWVDVVDTMEARNFVTAREMVMGGSWIVPTMNGQLRLEKPPLPTWLTAFAMKITGDTTSEWIARIPSAIVSVLFIFLVYELIKTLTKNNKLSFMCSFASVTMFMLMRTAKENNWDIYGYVFAMGTAVFYLKGMERQRLKEYLIGGLFLAMSIMSKGPVGVYGLLLPFFISHILIYGTASYKRDWKLMLSGVLFALLLSSLWPAAVVLKHKSYFLSVLEKEKNTWSSRNVRSIFYYLDYFIYTGIWMFFSLAVLFRRWMERRVGEKKLYRFFYVWNILTIILISLVAMKRKRYGIPIYMSTSLMIGCLIYYYAESNWEKLKKSDRFLVKLHGILTAAACVGAPGLLLIAGYFKDKVGILLPLAAIGMFSVIALYLVCSWRGKNQKGIQGVILAGGMAVVAVNLTCYGFVKKELKSGKKQEYPLFKEFKRENTSLEVYSEKFVIDDVWHSGTKIKTLNELPADIKEFWFLSDKDKGKEEEISGFRVVEEKIFYKADNKKHIAVMHRLKK